MSTKTLLLYGRIDDYKSCEFNESIQELESDDEILLRINTTGGSPEYGWGIISMFKDLPNVKKVKVDGQAHSMGAFILCYVQESEALDVAEFLIHRAAYPSYFEQSESFSEPIKENLIRVNQSLEKAFRDKVDVPMFEAMKGIKVKDIFSMDSRVDVYLSAKEAKKIGLISKVIPLTASAVSEVSAFAKAASSDGKIFIPKQVQLEVKPNIQIQNPNKMTRSEFIAAHPELFAQIQNEAITAERDRVGSLMAFHELDPETVTKAIKEGTVLTATMSAEFTMKAIAKNAAKGLEKDSAKDLDTEDQGASAGKTEAEKLEAKKTSDFVEEAKKLAKNQLGLN